MELDSENANAKSKTYPSSPAKPKAKHLLATTKTKDQVESALLLDVVVAQSATVLQLLSGKDQTLLIRGNTLLVLNLGLDVINCIRRLNLQRNSLASQSLDKDLHTTTETKDQVECGLLLDVVIRQGSAVLQLLSSKDQTLLVRGNTLLVLNL